MYLTLLLLFTDLIPDIPDFTLTFYLIPDIPDSLLTFPYFFLELWPLIAQNLSLTTVNLTLFLIQPLTSNHAMPLILSCEYILSLTPDFF